MADVKISALSSGTPAQTADQILIARGGGNYTLSPLDIANYGMYNVSGPPTKFTTVLVGDSITAHQGVPPLMTGQSYFEWGNVLSGGIFEVTGNLGVSGYTSAQILTELASAIALAPTCIDIMGGTNDLGTYTTAQTIANLRSAYQQITAAGIYCRAYTILPRSFTTPSTYYGQIFTVNNWIREYWRNNPGGECVDAFTAVVAPTFTGGTTGGNLANTYVDTVHPNNYGSYLIGSLAVAPALQKWGSGQNLLPTSALDDTSYATGGPNVSQNPLMQGTGGTLTGLATGTAATNYTIGGTLTTVASLVARSDGLGNDQQIVLTPSLAGQYSYIQGPDIHANLTVGSQYIAVCEVNFISGGGNISGLEYGMVGTSATFSSAVSSQFSSTDTSVALNLASNTKMTLRTPVWTATSQSFMAQMLQITAFTNTGTTTVKFGKTAIYLVTT